MISDHDKIVESDSNHHFVDPKWTNKIEMECGRLQVVS